MPLHSIAIAAAAALLSSILIPLWLIPRLRNAGAVDTPTHRSSHVVPTVRGGGIGVAAAMVLGVIALALLEPHGVDARGPIGLGFLLTVITFCILGAVEDLRRLRVASRLLGQFIVGLGGAATLLWLPQPSLPLIAGAGLAAVVAVNTANFMDGINGLSSLHAIIYGAYFVLVGFQSGSIILVCLGLIYAASFAGFLPWNIPRARVFLGDAGSYVLGAGAWYLGIIAITVGVPWLVAAAPMAIYVGDVSTTLVKRVVRGERLTEAHSQHVYQQWASLTPSHSKRALAAATSTAVCSFAGLATLRSGLNSLYLCLVLVLIVAIYCLSARIINLMAPPLDQAFGKQI